MKFIIIANDSLKYGEAIVNELRALGHECYTYNNNISGVTGKIKSYCLNNETNKLCRVYLKSKEKRLINKIKEDRNIILIYLLGEVVLSYETEKKIQKLPNIKISWLYDKIERIGRIETLLSCDYIFSFAKNDVESLINSGGNAKYLPLFADTKTYKPILKKPQKKIDILFIGSWFGRYYSKRRYVLSKLNTISNKNRYEYRVYGGGGIKNLLRYIRDKLSAKGFRENVKLGGLSHSKINALYNISKIVVNVEPDNQEDSYPMRIFEVPASGAYILSNDMKGLDAIYLKSEHYTFDNIEKMELKIRSLIEGYNHRGLYSKILHNHIVKKHSLKARIQQVLQIIQSRKNKNVKS